MNCDIQVNGIFRFYRKKGCSGTATRAQPGSEAPLASQGDRYDSGAASPAKCGQAQSPLAI